MPIYEYRCENHHLSDVVQRMSEASLTSCPVCGAPAQRVMHAPAVHFKGSGFYNTDYGTKKRSRELKEAGEGTGKYETGDGNGGGEKKEGKKDGAEATPKAESGASKSDSSSSGGDKPAKKPAGGE